MYNVVASFEDIEAAREAQIDIAQLGYVSIVVTDTGEEVEDE